MAPGVHFLSRYLQKKANTPRYRANPFAWFEQNLIYLSTQPVVDGSRAAFFVTVFAERSKYTEVHQKNAPTPLALVLFSDECGQKLHNSQFYHVNMQDNGTLCIFT